MFGPRTLLGQDDKTLLSLGLCCVYVYAFILSTLLSTVFVITLVHCREFFCSGQAASMAEIP